MDAVSTGGAASAPSAVSAEAGAPQPNATPEAHRAPKGPDGRFRQVQDVADARAAQDASQGGGETQQQAAARRKLQLKVYGEEHSLDLDDGTAQSLAKALGVDPERLGDALQKSAAGSRAMSEAAKERRAVAEEKARVGRLLSMLRESPEDALGELGVDLDALALKRLQSAAQRDAMTPEELAFSEREQALAQREAKLQQAEQQRQAQESEVAQQAAMKQAQETLIPALEAAGLPRTHASIALMADVAIDLIDAGVTLTPEQVAQETRALVVERTQAVLRGMQPAQLAQVLGKDLVRALMQHTVEASRASRSPPPQIRQAPAPAPADDEPAFLTPSQALRMR